MDKMQYYWKLHYKLILESIYKNNFGENSNITINVKINKYNNMNN